MKRQTKIIIRRVAEFIRTALFVLALIFGAIGIVSIDGSILFSAICFAIGAVCFGISYFLNELLWETAWSGDKKSPFDI